MGPFKKVAKTDKDNNIFQGRDVKTEDSLGPE